MILSDEIANIDYGQRVHRVVFQGILHKRVSRPTFPQFRVPRLFRCFFGQTKAFFCWHCRHWKLYDDGIFVYFESENSERPLGGVKLGMADMPLSKEMQQTVTSNVYPAQVDVRCRLTVPSTNRVLHLFSEQPEECARLREQITIIVNNIGQIQLKQITEMAVESRLCKTNSNGSLLDDFSAIDDKRAKDDDCTSEFSYDEATMEQLRREMFSCVETGVVDEKKRQFCEEIGITISELMADENTRASEEIVAVESGDEVPVSSGDVELTENVQSKKDVKEICRKGSEEQGSP
ncbi:uncharacterized protein LOC134191489 isoform X1 [Corticium candelabrum]|uniref:uncharacterized protein LOC134191489 isoform X1 n=1 Tax=Corticium candelabrum TaxID=121492 RepID=UPI002E25E53A|nr:uncharacterized protein LOC134191489 isoform X1 [Corticium candelabrum]